ncbi:serine protease [Kribbella qitaiheensis]|uniref:S1 family peptidase n=1 Tax=Kribbella qitaiheensis TaxID=1544730 RepID=UPI00361EDA37
MSRGQTMVEDGRRELPKPPRRVPSGMTAQLTSIQAPTPVPSSEPPLPPRLRWRFLIPLIVFALVVGAGAGWLIREDSLRLDTAEVLELAGPSVVRVFATTCEGTGESTGVLLADGLILTAASAIKQPMSVAFLTADGRVRRANALGTSADGVALLRMIGRLDDRAATLAQEEPAPRAELAVLGFIAAGRQTIQPVGTTKEPRPLPSVLNPTKLGSPVLDKSGQVVGLITGNTVADATVVPLARLRQYSGSGAEGITPELDGSCQRARGPQITMTPDLVVANTALAGESLAVLRGYLTAMNKHDFRGIRTLYSTRLAGKMTEKQDMDRHETSFMFGARIIEVTRNGVSGANVRMTFTVLFSPNSNGAAGQTCNRLDNRYQLVREGGRLRVDLSRQVSEPQNCDSD